MAKFLSSLGLLVVIGCAAHLETTHYSRDLSLSLGHDVDLGGRTSLRLVSIGQDATTTIELVGTGQRITAKPGEFFVSEAFGPQGLQLVSASTNEALLRQRWAETK